MKYIINLCPKSPFYQEQIEEKTFYIYSHKNQEFQTKCKNIRGVLVKSTGEIIRNYIGNTRKVIKKINYLAGTLDFAKKVTKETPYLDEVNMTELTFLISHLDEDYLGSKKYKVTILCSQLNIEKKDCVEKSIFSVDTKKPLVISLNTSEMDYGYPLSKYNYLYPQLQFENR
jgi:aspartyl aminopeptidase